MHKLSAETYRMIVKSLRSDSKGRQGEKRRKPRVGLRTRIDIQPRTAKNRGAASFVVWLRDISREGLGMVTSHQLAPKSHFVVHFEPGPDGVLALEYVVTHCKTLSKGLYSVGAILEKAID